MDNVIMHQQPSLEKPTMVAAMAGWPDAQTGGTGAVKYLIRKLSAEKFGELDSEEFYQFTRRRPIVRIGPDGQRIIRWPTNNFYQCKLEATSQEFVFFVGMEPQLKWRTYTAAVMDVIRTSNTQRVIFLGSLLDATPHTRESHLTGSATTPQLQAVLEEMGVHSSKYEGPTGAPTVLMEACRTGGIEYASLWAHAPHYLQASPNPKSTYQLLKQLTTMVSIDLNLKDLAEAAEAFEAQVNRVLADNQEMSAYVRKLEEQHDQAAEAAPREPQGELPSPDVVIQELEEFLRGQQPRQSGIGDEEGDSREGPKLG